MKLNNQYRELTSQVTVEMNLLLELIKAITDEEKIESYKLERINWRKFYQLALHHRVIPLVYSNINRNKVKWIPKEVINVLKNKYQQNVFSMLKLTSEMDLIAKHFNNNNLPALFLKGPILGEQLYGNISLRTSKDIDILISPSDIIKTKKLLLKLGYIEKEETEYILNEHKLRTHHTVFNHSESKFSVEIHWRLNDLPDKEPNFDVLWNRRRTSHLTKETINILGEEDMFLYLVSHGARHGWFRLRWLADIDRLILKGIEWQKLSLIMKEYANDHIVGQSLILSQGLLNTYINKELSYLFTSKAKELSNWAMIYIKSIQYDQPFPHDLISINRYNWALQKNSVQKLKFILLLSYPTYRDYQVFQLPKNLHFLYFPLRPFIYTGRKLGILKLKENG
ncbi:nucleotidyltransferase family protein [Niallia taxi]|uniref:nucleotidyltransferase domain-containing protein n=1 Tax=Niallia taxi TaxID=2499688 RepID=UPI00203E4EA8|nr:nucleotidyltransferase family protein [Niallia taxi]MCM3216400.1 nucleotidyltransferase family protein [Niallia taxi]